MAPSQDHPFDHSGVDFTKIGQRRLHMEAFFRHLGLWDADEVEELRTLIEPEICGRLQQAGLRQVGHAFFEYYVDKKLWYNILGHHNVPFEDQPWPSPMSIRPPKGDLSEGISRFYQAWLLGCKASPRRPATSQLILTHLERLTNEVQALREDVAGLKEQERRN